MGFICLVGCRRNVGGERGGWREGYGRRRSIEVAEGDYIGMDGKYGLCELSVVIVTIHLDARQPETSIEDRVAVWNGRMTPSYQSYSLLENMNSTRIEMN